MQARLPGRPVLAVRLAGYGRGVSADALLLAEPTPPNHGDSMLAYILHDTTSGALVSLTTAPPDPVPAGQTLVVIGEVDAARYVDGFMRWNVTTRALEDVPGFDPHALEEAKAAAKALLEQSIPTMRQWASDARGTTVTSGNAVATLQVVVNRLGTFFDKFADLLELRK